MTKHLCKMEFQVWPVMIMDRYCLYVGGLAAVASMDGMQLLFGP
jgi:hypothetical protein